MAIVRQSESAIASSSVGTDPLTITKPTGVATNDVLVAFLKNNLAVSAGFTSTPTNWVEAAAFDFSGVQPTIHIFYKIITNGAGEPANYSWQYNGSNNKVGLIARYSGVDTSTPEDVAFSGATASNKTSIASPAIITATDGAQVISFAGAPSGELTAPGSLSQFMNSTFIQIAGAGDLTQASAGSTGTFTWSASVKNNLVAVTWALRPGPEVSTLVLEHGFVDHGNPGVLMERLKNTWQRQRGRIFIPDLWLPKGARI